MVKHARERRYGDEKQQKEQQEEFGRYVGEAFRIDQEQKLKDVFVTDHKPIEQKYLTLNQGEDYQYFNYIKSLE